MEIGKYGVFSFTDQLDAANLAELAKRVEDLGYSTLWYPEAFNYETFALGGFLLSNSTTLQVASGIANIYGRDPSASVMGCNSLNSLYNGRFLLGLGVSHAPLVADVRGHDYKKPVATMRSYLKLMDTAWEAFGGIPEEKPVVLAALGPKMTRLSSEQTLGTFPYNITVDQVARSKSAMPAGGLICCEQKICLTSDPDEARKVARAAMAPYLSLPNYFNNWFRLGFEKADLADGGSDRLMDAMVLWGDKDSIKDRLDEYLSNGADQVVIQALRTDGKPGPDYHALEAMSD